MTPSPRPSSAPRRPATATRAALAIVALAALAPVGCGGRSASGGPPAIPLGATCDQCGMRISDLAFASERLLDAKWLRYDSIECLIADRQKRAGGVAYLPDHDTQALHPASEMWVVKGSIASPMGGGYAAFAGRAAADSVAAATKGTVDRLDAFASGGRP